MQRASRTCFGTQRIQSNSVRNAFNASYAREKDRKSTRLNSSHSQISYAVFCLKKKKLPDIYSIPWYCILGRVQPSYALADIGSSDEPIASTLIIINSQYRSYRASRDPASRVTT